MRPFRNSALNSYFRAIHLGRIMKAGFLRALFHLDMAEMVRIV